MDDGRLLRRRPVAALLAAEIVSMTGSQMTWLALPWFVFVTSGSATRMTLVVGAELAGLAALALPGSRLLGRWGAWRTMVTCDAARAPLLVAIPLLHWAGWLSLGVLLAATFALGALSAPYFAAQKIIVPELLGEDERLVSKANALFQGATRITLLLGPVAGGVLIAAVSAPAVLLVDGLTYVVAAALVLGLVPRPRPTADDAVAGGVLQGLRFLAGERLLRVWTPVFALGDAAWAAFFISVPVLVVARFDADPRVAGWLLASFGVGAVAGNIVAYRLVARFDGLGVIAACIMGQALPLWVLTVELPPAAYSAALAVSGLANGLVNPSIHSLMTLRVPPPLRPTVMTATMLVFVVAQPIGIFGAGPILDAFGTRPVLFGFAAVQTVTMAVIAVTTLRVRGSTAAADVQAAAG